VRWALACTGAATSAVLLWLASPAAGFGWVAWVALVPVALAALALEGTRAGRASVPLAYGLYLETQLVPALPFGIAERQWGSPPLPIMVGDSPVLFAALLGVPLFALLLYALRFPQPLARPGAAATVLVPAVLWTALDLLRAKGDPAGLWGPLFLTQHDLPAARLAALAGPWLLTFLLVATAWALASLFVHRRPALPPAVAAGTLLAGLAVAAAGLPDAPPTPAVAVGVVQPGYDTAEYVEYEPARFFDPRVRNLELATLDLVEDLGELTREAAAQGAELVVWPEAVAWVHPFDDEETRAALAELVEETGVALVVPAFLDPESAVAGLTPGGEPTALRPKQRPMWFLGERTIDAPAGPKDLGVASVGTLLGVDSQDPASARTLARLGAQLLASATHDWQELLPQQHAYAQLHASALRIPVAKADWRYGSAIWDGAGRLLVDAGLERERTVLVASVGLDAAPTPYRRLGDVLGWAAAVGAAALLGLGIRSRRRW
jgi:apolipoprotein N-acyltransferase